MNIILVFKEPEPGAGAGFEICLEPEPEPENQKRTGSGNAAPYCRGYTGTGEIEAEGRDIHSIPLNANRTRDTVSLNDRLKRKEE